MLNVVAFKRTKVKRLVMVRCAVLIVNGFDRHGRWGTYSVQEAREYPWIKLCLRELRSHSSADDYHVLVWDNGALTDHRRVLRQHNEVTVFPRRGARVERSHAGALDLLVRLTPAEFEYVITLDNDAFPVRDGWIDRMITPVAAGAGLCGVYRDELAPQIRPFIHPSCLCARREDLLAYGVSFLKGRGEDIGQNLAEVLSRGRGWAPLRRTNVRNFHFIMGGLYGDLIYHHGAGSRRPRFWGHPYRESDELIRQALRKAAFHNLPELLAVLRGIQYGELGRSLTKLAPDCINAASAPLDAVPYAEVACDDR